MHLVQQVSTQSKEIFEALAQYNMLNKEVSETLPFVKNLRKHIAELSEVVVKNPLQVNKLIRRRGNYNTLARTIESVLAVKETRKIINDCVKAKSHFVETLDMIDETKKVLETNLAGVNCFKYVKQDN
jgi:hypothetical protein